MFEWRFALVRLSDDDAAAVDLHVLMFDDDFEFADLFFEFLHAPVQPRDLLGLDRQTFSVFANSAESAAAFSLRFFALKKRIVPARPLASRKFRMMDSVSIASHLFRNVLVNRSFAHDIEIAVDEEQPHDVLAPAGGIPNVGRRVVAEVPNEDAVIVGVYDLAHRMVGMIRPAS